MNESQFMALPESQRKALQQKLIDQGLYVGKPDGRYGGGTKAAFELEVKRQQDEAKAAQAAAEQQAQNALRAKELEIQQTQAQTGKTAADAEAQKIAAEQQRKAEYDETASSGLGMAAKIGATGASPLLGVTLGRQMGKGLNALADRSQTSKNQALGGAASDRLSGLTTREGARVGTERSGALPSSNAALRVGGRMLPHMITGGAMLGKGGLMIGQQNPDDPYYAQMADRALGLGMLGTGAGILEQGGAYAVNPGVSPDARSISIMESNALRRGGPQSTLAKALAGEPEGTPPRATQASAPAADAPEVSAKPSATPGSKAYLVEQAKSLGLKGTSKMTKSDLAAALAETMAEHGGKRTVAKRVPKIPSGGGAAALAAGLGYAMTPDSANAATGEPSGNQAQALTNAGIAGGVGLGTSKLAEALGPAVRGTMGMAGDAMAPASIDAMTDYSPDDMAQGRNALARNLPEALQFGAVDEARQMATVPERAQRPAPAEGPFPQPIMGRLSRMQAMGASPEQVAQFLNQAMP